MVHEELSLFMIYLIGSLRNTRIPEIAIELRASGLDIFDDWFAAGPEADDYWKKYEDQRGRSYKDALKGAHAQDVFNFDKSHLDASDGCILVLPAGKSGHMELAYMRGSGKFCYILFDGEPALDRWDIMYNFATDIVYSVPELIERLKNA